MNKFVFWFIGLFEKPENRYQRYLRMRVQAVKDFRTATKNLKHIVDKYGIKQNVRRKSNA